MNNKKRIVFDYKTMEITDKKVYNPISAVGVLFRKFIDNIPYVLLMKYSNPKYNYLDDFGGKTDFEDKHPYDTAIRETLEESNNIINPSNLIMNNKYRKFYNKRCKYLCYVVNVEEDFFKDTTIFGNVEIKENIGRTLHWYKVDEELFNKVSVRIKSYIKKMINRRKYNDL